MKEIRETIEEFQNQPFQWGTVDCLIFSGTVAQKLTGYNIIDNFKGQYRTARQAVKMLYNYGIEDLDEIFGYYFEQVNPNFAKRGDVVIFQHDGLWSKAFGVVTGGSAVSTGEDGLMTVPMSQWIRAWSIK